MEHVLRHLILEEFIDLLDLNFNQDYMKETQLCDSFLYFFQVLISQKSKTHHKRTRDTKRILGIHYTIYTFSPIIKHIYLIAKIVYEFS